MIKRTITLISLLILVFACDTIEGPYVEGNPFTCDYNANVPTRKILLEDFTGYQCVNCPRANEEIKLLLDRYPCHVIPVAIHYGFFAEPAFNTNDADYRTTEGTSIGQYFDISESLPIGMVNRIPKNENYNLGFEDWSIEMVNLLSVNLYADIEIIADASVESDSIIAYSIELIDIGNLGVNYHLVVAVLENKVIGKQKDGSQTILDYEHNHMLRAGLLTDSPIWGIPVSLPYSNSFSYTIPDEAAWNRENLELLVYVYNSDTKEVIQAEAFHIGGSHE